MLTLIVLQNLWWVFLLTTIALVVKCFLTQKQLTDLKNDVAYRKSLAKKRFRMTEDLGDEISNGFNNIKIIAKESKSNLEEASKRDFLKIQKLCNDQISHMEDVNWVVKTRECLVEDLIFKLEDYVDDVFREKGIEVEIDKKGIRLDQKIGYIFRRNYLLFFKEVINIFDENTLPDKVKISFEYLPNHSELWVKNEYSQKINTSLSIGPRILKMRQLAEGIGGKTIIKDQSNIYEIGLIMKRN